MVVLRFVRFVIDRCEDLITQMVVELCRIDLHSVVKALTVGPCVQRRVIVGRSYEGNEIIGIRMLSLKVT